MGRKACIPQGTELRLIIEQHPDLSYPQLHKLYNWKGKPSSVRNAAVNAGIRRQPRKEDQRNGGGPLDVGVMSRKEFWGKVDVALKLMEIERQEKAISEALAGGGIRKARLALAPNGFYDLNKTD